MALQDAQASELLGPLDVWLDEQPGDVLHVEARLWASRRRDRSRAGSWRSAVRRAINAARSSRPRRCGCSCLAVHRNLSRRTG